MLGQSSTSDRRISSLLDELRIEYELDENGDFVAIFKLGEARTQRVFISSSTMQIADLEVRKIYSIGYRSDVPLSMNVANLLLSINSRSKLGAWQVIETSGGYYAAYNAQIAAETDAMTLLTVIKAVIESADNIEHYLTGDDVF